MLRAWVACAALALWVGVAPAAAQTRPAEEPRRSLAVATGIVSGGGLGASDAGLRGRSGEPFRLFATSSRVTRSVPLEIRAGYRLLPGYEVELRATYSRPQLQTAVSGDAEGAPALTVAERVNQYTLDGGVLIPLRRTWTAVPFLSAGAGYGWVVHEGFTLLEHGATFRGGGGVRYPLTTRGRWFIKGAGIRGDAALVVMTGGASLGDDASRHVAATAAVYVRF